MHIVIMITALFGLAIPFSLAAQMLPGIPRLLIEALLMGTAWTISVYLARVWLDKRSFSSLGAGWNAKGAKALLTGIGIGGAIMAAIFLVEAGMGWIQIESIGWVEGGSGAAASGIGAWIFLFILVGWYEELYFRGYLLSNLAEGMNRNWALALSTIIFSAAHLTNPNSSIASLIGIIAAGLFLGYAYIRSRDLWLPVGIHIGWNVFEGVIFGFPVSGIETGALVHQFPTGPEIITGGSFGPEAGMILLPALLLGIWLVERTKIDMEEKSAS